MSLPYAPNLEIFCPLSYLIIPLWDAQLWPSFFFFVFHSLSLLIFHPFPSSFSGLPCIAHSIFGGRENENNANQPSWIVPCLHGGDGSSVWNFKKTKAIVLMMCLELYWPFWTWLHFGTVSSGNSLQGVLHSSSVTGWLSDASWLWIF